MSRKTSDLYIEVLKYIETNIFEMKPSNFMLDFEMGMRKAIKEVYPYATLNGCWFHYCSAIRRKMIKLGFCKQIKNTTSNVRFIYRMIHALPLLPSGMFLNGYNFIKSESQKLKLEKTLRTFFSYFESYWINMVCYVSTLTCV